MAAHSSFFNLDSIRQEVIATRDSYYLTSCNYVHVGFRFRVRNLLDTALAILEHCAHLEHLYHQIQTLSASNVQSNRSLADELQQLQKQKETEENKLADQLKVLQTERDEIATKMKESESTIRAQKYLNDLLYQFIKEQGTPAFYYWLHCKKVKIEVAELDALLTALKTEDLVANIEKHFVPGSIDGLKVTAFLESLGQSGFSTQGSTNQSQETERPPGIQGGPSDLTPFGVVPIGEPTPIGSPPRVVPPPEDK